MKKLLFTFFWSVLLLNLVAQIPEKNSSLLEPEETVIGETYWDRQSYATIPKLLHMFDDGTFGAVWTISLEELPHSDRGTAYNYFSGATWNDWPEVRIESVRSGWGGYAPFGPSGELVVSTIWPHDDDFGLNIMKREQKGSGAWQESVLYGPAGYEDLMYPKMITGGPDNQYIYILAQTRPLTNLGQPYKGMDGALLYSRSTDGGQNWDILNHQLPGTDSALYDGFKPDCYAFAEPKDNVVAFVAGSYVSDLFLMKSEDYGETFEKTIIWDHPYDLIEPTFNTDTFYAVDGAVDVMLDLSGKAHVVFGIVQTWYNAGQQSWKYNKMTDGVGYWNEDRAAFSSNKNALNPNGHPESELITDESLIGWAQDMDGDSIISYLDAPTQPLYYYFSLGISSMPQIVCDEQGRLFFVFSSYTETYDNGLMNYRRLFMRSSLTNGQTWEKFYHFMPGAPYGQFSECVFPSMIAGTATDLYFTFMTDAEPGIVGQGSPEPFSHNSMVFVKIPKDEIVGMHNLSMNTPAFSVEQNFPNPFSGATVIRVSHAEALKLYLRVFDLNGRKLLEQEKQNVTSETTFKINAKNLAPGIYFYTVSSEDFSETKRMIVW